MSNTSLLGSFGGQAGDALMFRNRIVNGDMRIDQRATAISTNTSYSVDRWRFVKSNDATESVAQNADAPTGFSYSLRHTISVADGTIAAAQYSGLEQRIEGYNIADFSFGTANAQSITIQFWVRGTKVGQYTGVASNSDFSRNCPFNFNINTTNTWELKTVTLPGCTDGSWNVTNGIGLILQFSIALGSTYTTGFTAGTWNTNANCRGSGSPVNGLDSTANIFAITGVQLEAGPTATPFERRPIGVEQNLCRRYYVNCILIGTKTDTTWAIFPREENNNMRIVPTIGNNSMQNGASGAGMTGYSGTVSTKAGVYSAVGGATNVPGIAGWINFAVELIAEL